jgi:hypothetical protein
MAGKVMGEFVSAFHVSDSAFRVSDFSF